MKKLRLGLVGCGNMMASHVKASNEIKNLEITAVCDIVRENAEKAVEILNANGETAYILGEIVKSDEGVILE